MTGKLYIDGIDAFTAYGVFILEGGYAQFVQWPSLKPVEINDWAEEDGIEPDLTSPVLDTRQFSVRFGAVGQKADVNGFIYLLSQSGSYHTLNIPDLGSSFNVRLVSNPEYREYGNLSEFSLQFADDYPLDGYTYLAPSSSSVPDSLYEIDETNLADYGVRILQGTLDELLNVPTIKMNLLTNVVSQVGAIYDDEYVKFQNKDITLKCLLKAATVSEFWRNYNALLYDLTRAGQRELYVDDLSEVFPCFYKSANVNSFSVNGPVWCMFEITLSVITFIVGETEFVLATEDGFLITTEDGLDVIDLKID